VLLGTQNLAGLYTNLAVSVGETCAIAQRPSIRRKLRMWKMPGIR
jgi:hypothetical protein